VKGAVALALATTAALIVGPTVRAAEPLAVRATVSPAVVGFGDPFTYTVEVRADAATADAAGVRVVADTGAFATLAPARMERSSRGGESVVRLTQVLACLDLACAPTAAPRRVELPAARALAELRAGGEATATARAVRIDVTPRVPQAVVAAARPAYRRETDLRAATKRVSPDLLAALLLVTAAVLGVTALALAAGGLLRSRARVGREADDDSLVRALRLVRESAGRPVSDRRRAADLLARALAERGTPPLADEATTVAWSAREPAPGDALALASRAAPPQAGEAA
jgi:hypothetical protein